MTSRRFSREAGESWRKWGDPPAPRPTLTLGPVALILPSSAPFAATVWSWSIAIGAWLGVLASLIGG